MRKIYFGMLALALTFFTSCQFSENIYINEDGSGRMSFQMDGAELMEMMGDEFGNGEGKGKQTEIDSIVSFKDVFAERKDSIAKLSPEQQAKLKQLENFKMRMLMSAKDKKMNFDMFTEFKNVGELQDMFAAMNTAGDLDNKNAAKTNPMSGIAGKGTETSYTFKGNTFKRTVTITDKEKLSKVKDSLGQAKMMFASSGYKLNYHFPRKIKSVNLENAMFSDDRKSFSVEVNFLQYITNPEMLNVEVVLED